MKGPFRMTPFRGAMLAVSLVVVTALDVRAADTTEPFDLGASNVDFYVGTDGLGLEQFATRLYLDAMLGYGLTPELSFYLGTRLHANAQFGDASGDLYTGLYGTPVDTEHVDLDLFFEGVMRLGSSFSVAPGAEINFDMRPDQALFGAYLRVFFPIFGETSGENVEGEGTSQVVVTTEATVGTYLTLGAHHMLHLEYDMVVPFSPAADSPSYEVGGVALGYNVVVHEHIELINQVYLDIPQTGERGSIGLMVGLIATVP